MKSRATVDFETRSRVDLTARGAQVYAEHESTRVLCMAYHLPKQKTKLWWHGDPPPKDLLKWVKQGKPFEAQNVNFEYLIWNIVCVPAYGWPELHLDQLHCTMARCRAAGLPGALGDAGKSLGLKIVKDDEGERLLKLLTMPQTPSKKQPLIWVNDKKEMKKLGKYCVQDVEAERELSKHVPELPPEELAIWRLDLKFNNRGVRVDTHGIRSALEVLNRYKSTANKKLFKITGGAVERGTQGARLIKWCGEQGVTMPNMQEKTVSDTVKRLSRRKHKGTLSKKHKKVLKALILRQALGRGSTGKYEAMHTRTAADGRVHETVIYHKAHTGRWGGVGIQTQNFPRPTMSVDPEEVVAVLKTGDIELINKHYKNPFVCAVNALRPMMYASKGNMLASADFSAVEARVLMWIAGEEKALELLRTGCIYTDMAATIYDLSYKRIYSRYTAGDHEAHDQRLFGKNTILGLGYQMGGKTFQTTCDDNGTPIELDFAKKTVKTYRNKYPKVVQLWEAVNDAAIRAVITKKKTRTHGLEFKMYKHWLTVRLHSGRLFYYPFAHVGINKFKRRALKYATWVKGHQFHDSTYGGKLVENIVQAVARDLLRDSMLRLDRKGFDLILTIHDEVVAEVPMGFAERDTQRMERIMCKVPKWAKGMPISVSGWHGKRYRKG